MASVSLTSRSVPARAARDRTGRAGPRGVPDHVHGQQVLLQLVGAPDGGARWHPHRHTRAHDSGALRGWPRADKLDLGVLNGSSSQPKINSYSEPGDAQRPSSIL
jgi:hypothetical protein